MTRALLPLLLVLHCAIPCTAQYVPSPVDTFPEVGMELHRIMRRLKFQDLTSGGTTYGHLTATGSVKADRFSAVAGTQTNPSFHFDGDSDTGLYRFGADDLAVTTGGSARVRVNNSGMGIGTDPGSSQLMVAGSGATTYSIDLTTGLKSAGSLYLTGAGTKAVFKSPDGTCSACGPDNVDVWSCVSVTCP